MDDLSIEIFNSFVGKDVTIIGERKEQYEGMVCEGTNCDFEYTEKTLTRDVICIECEGKKYEITLWNTYGSCPSGWTTASWGHMEIREVQEFHGLTHKVKKPTVVRLSEGIPEEYKTEDLSIECGDGRIVVAEDVWACNVINHNPIFSCDPIGGDIWYPSGYYTVNDDAFIAIDRQEVKSSEQEPTEEQLEKARKEFLAFFRATMTNEKYRQVRPALVMRDGERMSVQASEFHYCIPRVSGLDKYEYYEVGFPSTLFEELEDRGEEPDTTKTVFPGIEEELIIRIIAKHGGIDFENSLRPEQYQKLPELLRRNPQEMALDKLVEMVGNLAKLVEEQRKAIEAMRYMTKTVDHDQEN